MRLIIFVLLLSFQFSAKAQLAINEAQAQNNPSFQSDVKKLELDIPSINEWIEDANKLTVEQSAENWAVLMQTIPANYGYLSRCSNSVRSGPVKYYNFKMTPQAQKAYLRFVRLRMSFIEESFTGWIFPTALERRQAAVASSFYCIENNVYETEKVSVAEKCADSFMWSQPFMNKERAYKALLAMATIYRTMAIFSCSEIEQQAAVGDAEMAADYRAIQAVFQKYFFDRTWPYDTKKHITNWLSNFAIIH